MLFAIDKLYRQVYSDDNLTEAWHHVRQGSEAAGADGVTIGQFQRRLFSQMKILQQELAERRYNPQPIKRFSVPKSNGKERHVGILTIKDRIVQRAILQVIEPLFEAEFEECSFGFRPGRSPQMAIDRLTERTRNGLVWVVDLDIESFFDQVNVGRLASLLWKKIADRRLRRLLWGWLKRALSQLRVEALVSDDADAFKEVADRLELGQQLCVAHVRKWVRQRTKELGEQA